MKDLIERGDPELMRREFLEHLRKFEEEGWKLFGWYLVGSPTIKFLRKPEKLSESETFKTAKKELECRIIPFQKRTPDGLVKYVGLEFGSESLYFVLYLLKDNKVCVAGFGEHKHKNKLLQAVHGGARYTITFKDSEEFLLSVLAALSEQLTKNQPLKP